MTRFFRDFGLYAAWLVAIVATAGSLYFSEVRLFVPCTLCWYQRIMMYPLVIILGVASYRQDRRVVAYALPLAVIGGAFSLFHYLEQKVPGFSAPTLCRVGVPCNQEYINWLGFITIPFLALVAFVLISVLLIGVARSARPAAVSLGRPEAAEARV
ncbi:disulfide oxidoreductase [Truepera radiovictrix]|uniref:Probable disulfide formation protein n=1 Tax=Truepera radiovictrix (strain DSM 17093 / CIP 108686 / LMG 22925 / RQ-24) TaxID=649638 RepID=D7CSD5_TRURR|nr:disulfide oxidoreductase [Truepera radiovictrix]ADI13667.1 Disulfide bond formation protein DsbB [Truepera radiovictrix DSM 17093]WMT57771.1 disulfide oxidoreductase [Truepera radiovictrix]